MKRRLKGPKEMSDSWRRALWNFLAEERTRGGTAGGGDPQFARLRTPQRTPPNGQAVAFSPPGRGPNRAAKALGRDLFLRMVVRASTVEAQPSGIGRRAGETFRFFVGGRAVASQHDGRLFLTGKPRNGMGPRMRSVPQSATSLGVGHGPAHKVALQGSQEHSNPRWRNDWVRDADPAESRIAQHVHARRWRVCQTTSFPGRVAVDCGVLG